MVCGVEDLDRALGGTADESSVSVAHRPRMRPWPCAANSVTGRKAPCSTSPSLPCPPGKGAARVISLRSRRETPDQVRPLGGQELPFSPPPSLSTFCTMNRYLELAATASPPSYPHRACAGPWRSVARRDTAGRSRPPRPSERW